MVQIDTLFQIKTAKKNIPFARHTRHEKRVADY